MPTQMIPEKIWSKSSLPNILTIKETHIQDVYTENFEKELYNIMNLIEKYTIIAIVRSKSEICSRSLIRTQNFQDLSIKALVVRKIK